MTPIKGWMNAATALGISHDTLARRRKEAGDRTRIAWWANADALRAWFEALIAPPPLPEPKPARRSRPRTNGGALDLSALRAEHR